MEDNLPYYVCTVCPKVFTSQGALNRHNRNTHDPEDNWYMCCLCEYRSPRWETLKRHYRIHGLFHPERPRRARPARKRRNLPSLSDDEGPAPKKDILTAAIESSIGDLSTPTSPTPSSQNPVYTSAQQSGPITVSTDTESDSSYAPPSLSSSEDEFIANLPDFLDDPLPSTSKDSAPATATSGVTLTMPTCSGDHCQPISFNTEVGDLLFVTKDNKIQRMKVKPGETFEIMKDYTGITKTAQAEYTVPDAGTLLLHLTIHSAEGVKKL